MRKIIFIPLFVIGIAAAPFAVHAQEQQINTIQRALRLEEALHKTLCTSPLIKAAEADIQIKLAEAWQVGLYINPALSIEFDDLGYTHDCNWADQGDFSVTLSQIFELGGKRSARQNVAVANVHLAVWDKQILQGDLEGRLVDAFIDAAAAQEKVKLREAQAKIAEKTLLCVLEKVKNGKASFIQQKKSEIAANTAMLANQKALGELSSARRKLSAFWGAATPDFDLVDFALYSAESPRPLPQIMALLENNPEILRARMAVNVAREGYQLERSQRIPDLEVSAGYYYDCYDSHDSSFSLEFSFEIPVFDRNQGNICRASWETWQSLYAQEDIELQKCTLLSDVYGKWQKCAEIIQKLQTETLQEAKDALKAVEEGYKGGKFECQDYLDAQGNIMDIQHQLIDALAEYHHLKNEAQRLAPPERR